MRSVLGRLAGVGLAPLGVGLLVFALDILSLTLTRHMGAVAAIWPADGVMLGFMVSSRRERPWAVLVAGLIGGVAAELSWGDLPLLAFTLPAFNFLGIGGAFLLLRRLLQAVDIEKPRHMAAFLLVTAGASLASAAFGAGLLHLTTGAPLGSNVVTWAASDALGYWTLTPLVQIVGRLSKPLGPRGLRRDAAVLAGFLCLLLPVFIQREYPFLFMVPLGLFAVAYLTELRGTAAALLLTGIVAAILSSLGRGPIALVSGDENKKLMVLQVFLASMTISILPIAAAMAERRAISLSLAQARDAAVAEERRAREANRIVQMAEEIALVGHWRRDLTDEVSTWSDQMTRLFGFAVGQRRPSRETALAALHPDDRQAFAQTLKRAETDGQPAMLDVRVLRDDVQRDLRVHVAAERNASGAVTAVYGMALDVTQSKAAEAQLTAARQAAEKAAAAKAEFLADMSHEIRTPLASILGFSNLLRDLPGLSIEARRFAERITAAGEGLLTAVGDILSFSKLEAGQIQIRPQAMSPLTLVDDVVQMLQPQAAAKGLILDGEVDLGVPQRLSADAPRLRQVLVNLVGNGVKYTDKGRVGIRLAYDAKRSRMRIEVSDTGPGIRNHARLFERYAQISSQQHEAGSGVGLGLAISKGLVEAMGGEIGVSSVVGKGSVFWVETPADTIESWNAVSRILIADDLEINRELIRQSLSGLSVEITEAQDGQGALTATEADAFDVIILDLAMPNGDGFATAEAIRAKQIDDKRPTILAVSATPMSDGLLDRLKVAGFDGFVPKPFVPSELADIVHRYCA
ncbi:MAG TPA: MASE1 domain-containing protein [Caulobacteraceae bacterium]|nr:MASE1 domain-containing protein [Caulobacteraceae bacterium]